MAVKASDGMAVKVSDRKQYVLAVLDGSYTLLEVCSEQQLVQQQQQQPQQQEGQQQQQEGQHWQRSGLSREAIASQLLHMRAPAYVHPPACIYGQVG